MVVVALYLIGLICTVIGFVYVIGAVLVMIANGFDDWVSCVLQVGLSWLFAASACNLPGVIGNWAVRSEQSFIQIVVGYAALVLPVALALFIVGAVQRRGNRHGKATAWLLASLLAWLTVGWAQIAQMFLFLVFALIYR